MRCEECGKIIWKWQKHHLYIIKKNGIDTDSLCHEKCKGKPDTSYLSVN